MDVMPILFQYFVNLAHNELSLWSIELDEIDNVWRKRKAQPEKAIG
jgi:hypothetical protein